MSRNTRLVEASPDQVWSVLSDGWLYSSWVVGAARIRQVEPDWPAVGSRIHHSAGLWPLMIDDHSEVLEADPPRRLVLRARGWPAGEAQVTVLLHPQGAHTEVEILEDAVRGPGVLVPRPVRSVAIGLRNTETLRRLALIAQGRP
ncbi:SRPBCC family protein [Auraticoccus monumenti]|uniref:Polyketide cyclase / dehydrase and lipid transport n=1 Tax=Auraticoccus monumenti TaxID=675864 RepID=A0A1G6XC62_9ACTN|nr:SRPBCC family protein [Auraticoccus monumenti]SDD74865.1 Polyketide cyclase / dehydrase and lipid transport [Auraticoccus monumenti]